jgi:hypothetical protein
MSRMDIDALVRDQVQRENAFLEEWAEKSLVDPEHRGVLVHVIKSRADAFHMSQRMTAELSSAVPYGEMHTHEAIEGEDCAA